MSISERVFDVLTKFPAWLESFDALQIPGWTVMLAMGCAILGLVFAAREFLSWFLKTNSIVDEVVRLETLVRDLQGDLAALESTVSRLQLTTGQAPTDEALSNELAALGKAEMPTEPSMGTPAKPQFRLDH